MLGQLRIKWILYLVIQNMRQLIAITIREMRVSDESVSFVATTNTSGEINDCSNTLLTLRETGSSSGDNSS